MAIRQNNKVKYDQAMQMYIKGTSQKDICEQLNVAAKTIQAWKTAGEWDKTKNIGTVTRSSLLRDAYMQLEAINQEIKENGGVPSQNQYNAKSVIGKEIDRLSESPIAVYVECLEEYTQWLCRNAPALVQKHINLMLQFLESKQ